MDQVIEQVIETKEEIVELSLAELAEVGGGVGVDCFGSSVSRQMRRGAHGAPSLFTYLTYRRYPAESVEVIRYRKFSASNASSLPCAFSACGYIRNGTGALPDPGSRTSWA